MNLGTLPKPPCVELNLASPLPRPQSLNQLKTFTIPKRIMAIVFTITEKIRGGYTASAIGEAIATEGKDIDELYNNIRTSTIDYFGAELAPNTARLYFLREEVLYIFPDRFDASNN
ncbi:hypothetical protein Pse7367_2713 [Thalassoporum mexicanum PCC 7367]|nr:hypothetical protein Pse7367_2713 [Pseudanabaena sp. PCC 7367]